MPNATGIIGDLIDKYYILDMICYLYFSIWCYKIPKIFLLKVAHQRRLDNKLCKNDLVCGK